MKRSIFDADETVKFMQVWMYAIGRRFQDGEKSGGGVGKVHSIVACAVLTVGH